MHKQAIKHKQAIIGGGYLFTENACWSAFCVFHAHFWEKTHSFKICALKENLSKFLNNMAYKTVTSMRDCVMKRNFM